MCNHLNLKILIHIFTIVIIIIMRGENFVAHLDGLGGTPVAHHCARLNKRPCIVSISDISHLKRRIRSTVEFVIPGVRSHQRMAQRRSETGRHRSVVRQTFRI
jgi:hypothetical protein